MMVKFPYEADAKAGPYFVEVKHELRSTRALRDAMAQLAYLLARSPEMGGLLVLSEPLVSQERLTDEWRLMQTVFLPDVMRRASLVVIREGQYFGLPELPDEVRSKVHEVVRMEARAAWRRPARRDSYYVILGLLALRWLTGAGPMTTEWLTKAAGFSYPTVAAALERLGPLLKRHPDRRIELRTWPRDEWARFVAVSEQVRSTTLFADRSGQPRTPDRLLKGLLRLKREDIGVGGVDGALHYHPQLDLSASPRLDLSVHCAQGFVDLDFVGLLDPALTLVRAPGEPVRLAVHVLRRREPFFDGATGRIPYADPIECLLDLHESRLEPQAQELLAALMSRREAAQ